MQFDWMPRAERRARRQKYLREWHKWFAWKPVPVREYYDEGKQGMRRYIFLETVFRKAVNSDHVFRYMTKNEYLQQKLKNPNL